MRLLPKETKQLLNERGLSNYYLFKRGGIPRSTISAVINAKKRMSQQTQYIKFYTRNIS